MVGDEARERLIAADFPLLAAVDVAEAAWLAIRSDVTGHAWVVQPGRPPLDYRFASVPGARTPEGLAGPPPPPLAQ